MTTENFDARLHPVQVACLDAVGEPVNSFEITASQGVFSIPKIRLRSLPGLMVTILLDVHYTSRDFSSTTNKQVPLYFEIVGCELD